jgi:anti-anti-sigma factor
MNLSDSGPQPVVLRFAGPLLAVTEADTVKEAINSHLRAGTVRLILDLTDVEFMDSTMIGVLMASQRRLEGFGGALHLASVAEPIQRVLMVLGLQASLRVYPDVEGAQRGFERP